jgi:UDP-N-acetylglucosamine 1-carboxyvinyltransferase
MSAVAGAGGRVEIKNVTPKHLECISIKLREMGVEVEELENSVIVTSTGRILPADLKTMPYPGFPTDMQPQVATVLCLAGGTSRVTEGVWENRFRYVDELVKMGARMRVTGTTATIEGITALTGAPLKACDLRAGAAFVIAGLCAHGTTEIEGVEYIERGYQDIVGKLRALGADITGYTDAPANAEASRAEAV